MKSVKKPKKSLADQVKDGHVNKTFSARCHDSHPGLKIGEYTIYGGSCVYPSVTDADIYIGFDKGMGHQGKFPWEGGVEFCYYIQDRHAPENVKSFDQLLAWTESQLIAGKKVHAGCIGGHGRTGLFFAALVRNLEPKIIDAIGYVRNNYCKKAVESQAQIDFLVKEYGCAPAKMRDKPVHIAKQADLYEDIQMPNGYDDWVSHADFSPGTFGGISASIDPVPSKKNIWGKTKVLTKEI